MEPLAVPYDGWTVDDLPDVDYRCELVDGALLVTPPGRPRHQELALALTARLPTAGRSGRRTCTSWSR